MMVVCDGEEGEVIYACDSGQGERVDACDGGRKVMSVCDGWKEMMCAFDGAQKVRGVCDDEKGEVIGAYNGGKKDSVVDGDNKKMADSLVYAEYDTRKFCSQSNNDYQNCKTNKKKIQ